MITAKTYRMKSILLGTRQAALQTALSCQLSVVNKKVRLEKFPRDKQKSVLAS